MIYLREEGIRMTKGKLFKIAPLWLMLALVLLLVVASPRVGPVEAG